MKLRIRANSLRLRLNQKEVEALAAGQVLRESIYFPGNASLSYLLESHSGSEARVTFAGGSIRISAPNHELLLWSGNEEIGMYYSLPAEQQELKLAIEKDLECLDGPVEEKDPDAFPRELAGKSC